MRALALGKGLRNFVDIVRDSLNHEDPACCGCGKALKGMPPFSILCHDCRDILAEGIVSEKSDFMDVSVPPSVFEAILVTAKPEASALAKVLMEKDVASRRVLARAYAHAVPVSEYMLTDWACMKPDSAGDAGIGLRAFTRAIASAFSLDYKGALQKETEDWQEAALARYSKGTKRKSSSLLYPVVVVENADTRMIEGMATHLARRGCERMIVIVAP